MRRWFNGLANKLRIAAVLSVLLVLVLIVNLVERVQMNNLEKSFAAMYRDRLMAESYLLELTDIIHQKEKLAEQASEKGTSLSGEKNTSLNISVERLISHYEATTLTHEEEVLFVQLKGVLRPLMSLETQVAGSENETGNYLKMTEKATDKLLALSAIQTKEGSRLISESNDIIMNQRSTSHFEIVILLFLGVIIQTLVLSSSVLHERVRNLSNLN